MGVDERLIEIIGSLEEISQIAKENNNLMKKIRDTLSTVVLKFETHRVLNISVKIPKYVKDTYGFEFKVLDCYDCELETDGFAIYVVGKLSEDDVKMNLVTIHLEQITLLDLLYLYHLSEANEGCLDALIEALRNQQKELHNKLEELKRLLTLVKVSTNP